MGSSDSKLALRSHLEMLLTDDIPLQDFDYWENLFSSGISLDEAFELIRPDDVRYLKNHQTHKNLKHFFLNLISTLKEGIREATYEKLTEKTSRKICTAVRILTRIMPFIHEVPLNESMNDLFWTPLSQQNDPMDLSSYLNTENDDSQFAETIGYNILSCLNRLLFLKQFTVNSPSTSAADKNEGLPRHKVDTRLIWKSGIGTSGEVHVPSAPNRMIKMRVEILRCYIVCLSASLFQTIDEYQLNIPLWVRVSTSGDLPYTANLFASLMSTIFSYDPVGIGVPFSTLFSNVDEEELVNMSVELLVILADFNPTIFITQHSGSFSSPSSHFQDRQGKSSSNQSLDDSQEDITKRYSLLSRNGRSANFSGDGVIRNVYRTMLSGIKKDMEVDMIYSGLCKLLYTLPNSHKTYLPKSFKCITFHQELLILFWHLLTTNQVFLHRMTYRLNSNKVLVPLLYLLLDSSNSRTYTSPPVSHSSSSSSSSSSPSSPSNSNEGNTEDNMNSNISSNANASSSPSALPRQNDSPSGASTTGGGGGGKNAGVSVASSSTASQTTHSHSSHPNQSSKVGLLHMCSFIILVLSADREFAVRLNEPFVEKFPLDIPVFQGCHADLALLVIHRVVVDSAGYPANDSFIDMLLTVLCNISAYVKSFCLESCLKLLNLFDRFSRPSWLFKAPYHYHATFFLLDMFNNLIQYQYEGNQQLVYSILRQKNLFLDLQNLELPKKHLFSSSPTSLTGGALPPPPSSSSSLNASHEEKKNNKTHVSSTSEHNTHDTLTDDRKTTANSNASGEAQKSAPPSSSSSTSRGAAPSSSSSVPPPSSSSTSSSSSGMSVSSSTPSTSFSSFPSSSPSSSAAVSANTGGGGGGGDVWQPTKEWFLDWKGKLPLQAITRLIHCLLPMVEAECTEKGLTDQHEVLEFLERTTMVGLLPVPHPIIIRNYQSNAYTSLWLTSYMWGVIFTKTQKYALYDWKYIKLIVISTDF